MIEGQKVAIGKKRRERKRERVESETNILQ